MEQPASWTHDCSILAGFQARTGEPIFWDGMKTSAVALD